MPNYVVDVTLAGRTWSYVEGEDPDPAATTWVADGLRIRWRRAVSRKQPEPMTAGVSLVTTEPADLVNVMRGTPLMIQVYTDTTRATRMATFYGRTADPEGQAVKVGDPARAALRYDLEAVDYMADLGGYDFTDRGRYGLAGNGPFTLTDALVESGRWPGAQIVLDDTLDSFGDPVHLELSPDVFPLEDSPTLELVPGESYKMADLVTGVTDMSYLLQWHTPEGPWEHPDPNYKILEPWVDPATGLPHTAWEENYGVVGCAVLATRTPGWWVPPYTVALSGGVVVMDTTGPTPEATWVVDACHVDTDVKWTSEPRAYPSRVEVLYKNVNDKDRRHVARMAYAAPDPFTLVVDAREWIQPGDAGLVELESIANTWVPDIGTLPGSRWSAESFTMRADAIPGILAGAPWIPDHGHYEPQEVEPYKPTYARDWFDPTWYPPEVPPQPYRRHAAYEAPVIVEGIDPGWHPDQSRRYVGLLTAVDLVLSGGHIDVEFSLVRRHPLAYQPDDGLGVPAQALTYADVLADAALAPTTYPAWDGLTYTDARLCRPAA